MKFKTWGSAMDSLGIDLANTLMSEKVEDAFQTREYFVVRAREVHRSFQAWCEQHSIAPKPLRDLMLASYKRLDPTVTCCAGSKELLECIPDEFNVRGAWEPREQIVSARKRMKP